jgi:UDP-glucuronate 4-epimerase
VPAARRSTEDQSPAVSTSAPYRLYNIGSNNPIELLRYIEILESALGRKAEKRLLPIQPGDVAETFADVSALARDVGYKPATPVEVGVRRFVDWYRAFYGVERDD